MPRYVAIIMMLCFVIGTLCMIKPLVPRYYHLYQKQGSVSVLVVKRELTAFGCFSKQVEIKYTVCVRSK